MDQGLKAIKLLERNIRKIFYDIGCDNDFQDMTPKVKSLSRVQLFVTAWTVAYQAPLSMRFSRQGYWRGLSFPSPGDPPNPGIEPRPPALEADALPSDDSKGICKKGPAFIACRLLDCSHSDWHEMVPHSGFDLHFSDNE